MITSVAPRVTPRVRVSEALAGSDTSYAMYCAAANEAPAIRTAMRYVAAVVAWLHTVIVETIAEVAEGTEYSVVAVVALGLD